MEDNIATQTETATNVKIRKPSGISKLLNKYFLHLDRGATLKGEVMAGITMFFLSICVIFMNMQIIANTINGNAVLGTSPGDPNNIAAASTYAQIYIGSILVAIIGSLVIGFVARLPITQLSTMGLASSLLCLVGTETGLTYYNLLFVNLIAGVLYCILVAAPGVRDAVYKILPASVRKVLPITVGLMFAFAALQLSGFVTTSKIGLSNMDSQYLTAITGVTMMSGGRKMAMYAFVSALAAMGMYVILKFFKRKHPVFWSLITGTAIFILMDVILCGIDVANTESFINFGRVWVVAASQASLETPFGDSYLTYFSDALCAVFANFSDVFTKGMDFTAYSGNTIMLVMGGVISYLVMGLYDAEGTVLALQDTLNRETNERGRVDFDHQKGIRKALLCNAGMNVIAPFLGIGGVTISKTSIAATEDNGKSGIVPIVASIGYLISLFIMVFPVLFATITYPVGSMNQWNYNAYGNGGFVYLMQGLSFGIADTVMICVGLSMLRGLKKINWKDITDVIPCIVTLTLSVALTNLAFGVVSGLMIYYITKLFTLRKKVSD